MFQEKGFKVFAGCFLDASLERLKSPTCVPVKLDVTKETSVLHALTVIKAHLEADKAELYAVVNNAGILVQPCPAEWQSLKDFRDMFEVNLLGTVAVTQSVLPLIRKSKGRIVCVSSIAGRVGLPTEAACARASPAGARTRRSSTDRNAFRGNDAQTARPSTRCRRTRTACAATCTRGA